MGLLARHFCLGWPGSTGRAFGEASALESVALKAATIMPSCYSKSPQATPLHAVRLQHRLSTWKEGDLRELAREERTIQKRLPRNNQSQVKRIYQDNLLTICFKAR